MDQKGQNLANMIKHAYFGPNLAAFGPKILIFTGGSKSFGIHVMENSLGTLFALYFGRAEDQMGKSGRFGAKNSIFQEVAKVLLPT